MASESSPLARRSTLVLLPAIATLAWWRLKQMWRPLLITWLGMISMVVLICSVPLFTQVSSTIGLRSALSTVPPGQKNISLNFVSMQPTSASILQAHQQIDQAVQHNLGTYVNEDPRFSVSLPPLSVRAVNAVASSASNPNQLLLTGYELDKVGDELTLLQGRLPVLVGSQIEIALTRTEASALKVSVGSVITASFPEYIGSVTWTLHVVGIFAPDQNWGYANNFQAASGPSGLGTYYPALASSAVLLPHISSLQISLTNRQLFGKKQSVPGGGNFFTMTWSYPFDTSRVNSSQLDSLLASTDMLSSQLEQSLQQIPGAAIFQMSPQGALFDVLTNYSLDTKIAVIPITALLLLILALVFFLVSTMSVALVERQTATIATLRSRGATRRHVFGAFVTQGLGLGLLALLLGPFVALLLVGLLIHLLLPAAPQSSLNVLTENPLQEALSVGWFAVAAVACAVLTLIVSVRRATRMDVLAFRRESARSTRRPFWRRLNLDIIGIILLCLGYIGYLYISQPTIAQQFGPGLLAILGILALIAPFLASAACFTLFLRLLPLCLRLGAFLAARRRKAPAVLAFAQMERAPRPASRTILLLALVVSTSMFILTYTTSQQQRAIDSANFMVGADFSGLSTVNSGHPSLAQQTAAYRDTPGVISATLGYTLGAQAPQTDIQTFVVAVDADTYAHTAFWSSQYSGQSLSSLMALLTSHRAAASNNDTVYAIIDDAMAKAQNLSIGSSFLQTTPDGYTMHFIVAGQIHYIPGVNDGSVRAGTDGFLCDYQSYASVYTQNSGNALTPNTVWLQTRSDTASLNSVRHAFPTLQDRRALIASNQGNPLYVNIVGVLDLGLVTALLLAALGVLFFSWLNTMERLTNFSVLRALGMAPRQVAAVFLWEQGGIYVAALALGLALGLFIQTFVGPALVFTDVVISLSSKNGIYLLPVQLITPVWLIGGLLGALVLVCAIALALMTRLVARPSLGQILRLNED